MKESNFLKEFRIETTFFQIFKDFQAKIGYLKKVHVPFLTQKIQCGDDSKNMSFRATKIVKLFNNRRTKRPKHLKSATATKYGKRASVPRSEALES